MAKKIWFGKTFNMHYEILHEIEKFAKEQGITDRGTKTELFFDYCKNYCQTEDDVLNLQIFRLELAGIIPHYFIESKDLTKFLHETKIKDYNGLLKYVKENGIKTLNPANGNTINDTLTLNVHTPYEKDGYTIVYSIVNGLLAIFVAHGAILTHCDSSIFSNAKEYKKLDPDVIKQTDFAINFLFYIICFPETVIDGVPKMENEETYNSGKTIKVSDKIIEAATTKTIIPHFRRGYFKHLESDYFVNKKGQIIFVHETMVKGKAKTITEKKS